MNIRAFFDEARRRRRKEHPSFGLSALEPGAGAARLKTYEAYGRVPVIHASALVHETAVLIGEVHIGADCYIGPHAVCRADQGSIVIERGTSLQDCCVVHTRPNGRAVVGELGQIGHGAMLHGCTIGRNVLIGMGAIVLDDAIIEDDAVVGAASLVTARQRVPARMIVRGNPAKVFREVTEEELAYKHEITMHYVGFARSGVGTRRARARIVECIETSSARSAQDGAETCGRPGALAPPVE
jgi:phenylacetic acid degradation protein